jgi:hypothetical protein
MNATLRRTGEKFNSMQKEKIFQKLHKNIEVKLAKMYQHKTQATHPIIEERKVRRFLDDDIT